MRHHLLRPAAIAAALTAVAVASATTAIAAPAAVLATTAAATPRTAAAGSTAPASPAGGHAVFLINGDQLGLSAPRALGACISIFDVAVPGPASQLRTLTIGGKIYVMPTAAVPYLGRGLDASLFDLSALTRAESAGRLPVRLSYPGRVPALPGVTITASGGGTAEGYLTAAGARTFGTALARQLAADHPRGSYGQDGLFAGGVSVALLGAAPVAPRPRYVMHTLTVDGTNLAGKPDTGDTVWLFNVDNASKFDDFIATQSVFYHGVAKFSVPAGHYWAIGDFITIHPKLGTFDDHVAVLPELTAGQATTVHLDARSASSKIQLVTPRSAVPQTTGFSMLRTGAAGPAIGIGWSTLSVGPGATVPSLYVSPTSANPATGTLTDVTSGQLNSPSSAPAIPYQYDLAYQSRGIIPAQRFVVKQASLATENARYYSANGTTGYLARQPVFPSEQGCYGVTYFPTRFPAQQTVYLSAGPSLRWIENYAQSTKGFGPGSGGQSGVPRAFLPGQRLTEDWGAYPLHPAPFVKLGQIPGAPPVPVSANRAGDTLRLVLNAFSDSTPGHTGVGVYPPFTATGSYEIDQNWTKIAGGALAHFTGFFTAQAKLSPARSLIRVVLNSAEPAKLNPLSTASRTVWTWWSAHEAGSTLPPGWSCQVFPLTDRACAAQPMMTLRYGVTGMGLNGATSPGQQVVRVSAGHLQLAAAPKVTSVAVFASLDGGKTWRAARVTGSAGSYAAVFPAPAGARVTLRTTAADASGGSVTETVTNAYQVAAAGSAVAATHGAAGVRAACAAAGPRRARCYALYAPEISVNAAIAARAAGRRVPPDATTPKGWGPGDLASAYRLPVTRGAGQTVALVDAYSTPHLASDLAVYRKQYGLPPCATATGCLRIVNQQGKASPLPPADPTGWGVEETLDVSMVSAACPRCKILLVEAKSPSFPDLAAAEDTAARLGAQVISNSYGARETGFSQAYAKAYVHPGHVVVASSGDFGFTAANFPANLAAVTAVGGTQLAKAKNSRGWTEQVWRGFGGSGSGCSAYVAKPAWQHDPHCPGRTVADVAAVAWNVAVYDSSITRGQGGPWLNVGGTSAASPLVAGVYALAGNAAVVPPGYEYAHASSLFDVTKGTNDWSSGTLGGICGYDYLCVAKPGYDAPTGLGTPNGAGAF